MRLMRGDSGAGRGLLPYAYDCLGYVQHQDVCCVSGHDGVEPDRKVQVSEAPLAVDRFACTHSRLDNATVVHRSRAAPYKSLN